MYRKLNPAGAEPREISEVVNNLVEGKSNNTGTFSLVTGGSTVTTLQEERIGYDSVILLMPLNSDAAAILGSIYVSSRVKGEASFTHAANSATRTFGYVIVG